MKLYSLPVWRFSFKFVVILINTLINLSLCLNEPLEFTGYILSRPLCFFTWINLLEFTGYALCYPHFWPICLFVSTNILSPEVKLITNLYTTEREGLGRRVRALGYVDFAKFIISFSQETNVCMFLRLLHLDLSRKKNDFPHFLKLSASIKLISRLSTITKLP